MEDKDGKTKDVFCKGPMLCEGNRVQHPQETPCTVAIVNFKSTNHLEAISELRSQLTSSKSITVWKAQSFREGSMTPVSVIKAIMLLLLKRRESSIFDHSTHKEEA